MFCIFFLAIPKASKIAQSSASRILLFFPKKTLLFFHWPWSLSFQRTIATTFLVSLDLFVYRTNSLRFFFASSRACFLHSIIITPLNVKLGSILLTYFIFFAGSTDYSIVCCHACYCLHNLDCVFCVNTKAFSGSSHVDTLHIFFPNRKVKFSCWDAK